MRKKIKNKKSKKAVSGIVATVLMIVVVIAVAGIISSFVLTTVTKLNSLSSACHALTNLQIKPDYTCKISVNGSELVEVMVEMPPNVESNLSGIAVKLNAYQFSKAIMIIPGLSGYVWISLESLNTTIPTILPKKGQAITYVINASGLGLNDMQSVAVAPVVSNGKRQQTCTYGQVVKLRKCVEAPILPETVSPGPIIPTPPSRTT